jgi:DNA-directed RNA polymerase specialized sigma24 family protein
MPISRNDVVKEIPGLALIHNGEYEAGWEKFYKHYHPIVTYRVARAGIIITLGGVFLPSLPILPSEIAHDVIANLFMTDPLLENLRAKSDKHMRAYFKAAVWNFHATAIRQKVKIESSWGKRKWASFDSGEDAFTKDEIADWSILPRYLHHDDPDGTAQFKEINPLIPALLDSLAECHARILRLMAEGMEPGEIAELLALGKNSMTIRINRAQEAARKWLKEQSPELHEELFAKTA